VDGDSAPQNISLMDQRMRFGSVVSRSDATEAPRCDNRPKQPTQTHASVMPHRAKTQLDGRE